MIVHLVPSFLIAWALAAQELVHASETRVAFEDPCSDAAVGVYASGRKARLKVEIDGLKPGAPLWLEVRLQPLDDSRPFGAESARVIRKRWRKVGKSGQLEFKKKIKLDEIENPASRPGFAPTVWTAQATWSQGAAAGLGGAGAGSVLVLRDIDRRFYQIDGPRSCTWETPPTVDSEYYFNSGDAFMVLTRGVKMSDDRSVERGFVLGLMPDESGGADGGTVTRPESGSMAPLPTPGGLPLARPVSQPLLSNPIAQYGWIFGGWERSSLKLKVQEWAFDQSWGLGSGEGGYFARRMAFSRVPAVEYRLDESGKCQRWIESARGLLDMGHVINEFYSVPRALTSDPAAVMAHLEAMRPNRNSCGSGVATGYRVGDDAENLLFFLETK